MPNVLVRSLVTKLSQDAPEREALAASALTKNGPHKFLGDVGFDAGGLPAFRQASEKDGLAVFDQARTDADRARQFGFDVIDVPLGSMVSPPRGIRF